MSASFRCRDQSQSQSQSQLATRWGSPQTIYEKFSHFAFKNVNFKMKERAPFDIIHFQQQKVTKKHEKA